MRLDLVAVNAAANVDTPRAPRVEREVFTPEELRSLLTAAEADTTIGPLVIVLACSGLRLGEGLALRWRDIDLARGTLRVERTLSEISDGKLIFGEPKTKRSRRTVELPERALAALRRQRAGVGAEPHPERLVFTDAKGGPWRRSNLVRRGWSGLLEAAKVPKLGFHVLRHTHATLLLAGGVPVHIVAGRLGHSSPAITLAVYPHAFEADGKAVSERLEALLETGTTR